MSDYVQPPPIKIKYLPINDSRNFPQYLNLNSRKSLPFRQLSTAQTTTRRNIFHMHSRTIDSEPLLTNQQLIQQSSYHKEIGLDQMNQNRKDSGQQTENIEKFNMLNHSTAKDYSQSTRNDSLKQKSKQLNIQQLIQPKLQLIVQHHRFNSLNYRQKPSLLLNDQNQTQKKLPSISSLLTKNILPKQTTLLRNYVNLTCRNQSDILVPQDYLAQLESQIIKNSQNKSGTYRFEDQIPNTKSRAKKLHKNIGQIDVDIKQTKPQTTFLNQNDFSNSLERPNYFNQQLQIHLTSPNLKTQDDINQLESSLQKLQVQSKEQLQQSQQTTNSMNMFSKYPQKGSKYKDKQQRNHQIKNIFSQVQDRENVNFDDQQFKNLFAKDSIFDM